MATSNAEAGPPTSASGQDSSAGEASSGQGNIEFFNAAQQLSIGTVTTTIVSGNCTYHVSVVNNSYGSGGTPQNEGPDVPFEEIVAWLKGPKFLRIYEEALGQRLSNTGVWFIESEEFRQLVEGKDVVVWGTGMPGAGKTVISSFSLERLKEIFKGQEGVGIVGAYIRYTERPPTRAIFAGLLSQLVKDHPCAYHYMRHIYIQKDRGDLSDLHMVKAFQDIVGLLSKVFLIIDGLDEADDGVKDELLRALPSLGANVLITSRPLELYSPRLPHALHVSIEARTEDIDHFVEEKIRSSSKLQAILRGKSALAEMLKTRIRESSRGMFLVARLQMDGVLQKGRSASSLLKALNQLPSGVDEMYKNTLDRINAQAAEDVSIAHRVFIWLLHSARDLLAHELQDALAISFEDETYDSIDIIPVSMILSMCGGFVTVEEQGEKVIGSEYGSESHLRFIHYTTHEFLKTIEIPEFASPHVYMAVACLIYLRQHTQRLQAWGKAEDPKTLRSYFASNPFLSYADQHWGKHASISQCSGPLHPFIQSYLAGCARHELVNHRFSLASEDTLGPSIRATALHLAAMYGLVDAITSKALPYLPLPQGLGGETPFHYAARFNQPPALEALLASYSGVNDQDKDGKTALMTACQHGHEGCVRTFMAAHEVKVELRDQHGRSAFWYACTCDNDRIPSLLLTSCAKLDVDVCDDDGNTAFAKACNSGLARTVGGVLRRTQLTPTKLLSEIGGEAALAKVLENHCAGQNEKEWSEEDRTALNTILDFLSSHESGMQAIDSEPEESDKEPPSVVVEPPDEPDIPPATVTGQDLTFEPTPPTSPPYTLPPNSLSADVLAPTTQSPPLETPVHGLNPVSLAHPRYLSLHETPPTIRDRSGTASGKVPVFQVRDGRTGRSRSRSPRPSQLTGLVRAHRSPSHNHRHKPSADTQVHHREIRSRSHGRSRSPRVANRRRRRPSPEARGRSPSPIPRPVSIAYRTWSQRSRSYSPPRPPIVIQPQTRRGSPAPLPLPVPIWASPIHSPPPLSPAMVPMQYPQVASETVSPRPVPIQNRESLRLRSIPNRGDTASPVRSGSPRIHIPYITRSPPPVQHSPPPNQKYYRPAQYSPPPLPQSPPMMQHQYSEGSTLVNQNTFDLRQMRPLHGTWGSGSTLVQANHTKSDRDVLGFSEMSAPTTPLFSGASPDDKLRTTATPPD